MNENATTENGNMQLDGPPAKAKKPRAPRKDAGQPRGKPLAEHITPIETLEGLIKHAGPEDKLALVKRAKAVIAAVKASEQLDPARDALAAELSG